MKKYIYLFIMTFLVSIFVPFFCMALENDVDPRGIVCGDGNVDLPGCYSVNNVKEFRDDFLPKIITTLVAYTGVGAVVALMIAGIQYLTSMGNDEKRKKAEKMIFYAILGVVIALVAYIIIQLVVNLEFA